jgi:cell division transport system ATP-binding protein
LADPATSAFVASASKNSASASGDSPSAAVPAAAPATSAAPVVSTAVATVADRVIVAPPEIPKFGSETAPVLPQMPDDGRQSQAQSGRSAERKAISGTPVILFEGISKVYPAQPNKPALNNISLKINAGEFIFLVGHSGSGKSTFIRLISRELIATKGRLTVAGEDVIRMRNWRVPYLRRNIGCVFQDFKLLPNKTAFENVAFALEVIGKSRHIVRTQVPEVLRLVGLEDKLDQHPDQLSGGEQQRVSIARAIVNRPPLLICDEPTGNLDPQTSLGIMRLLDRINRTGTTILVATHDREMVDSLRKRVVTLENGYLVRDQEKGGYGVDA